MFKIIINKIKKIEKVTIMDFAMIILAIFLIATIVDGLYHAIGMKEKEIELQQPTRFEIINQTYIQNVGPISILKDKETKKEYLIYKDSITPLQKESDK